MLTACRKETHLLDEVLVLGRTSRERPRRNTECAVRRGLSFLLLHLVLEYFGVRQVAIHRRLQVQQHVRKHEYDNEQTDGLPQYISYDKHTHICGTHSCNHRDTVTGLHAISSDLTFCEDNIAHV